MLHDIELIIAYAKSCNASKWRNKKTTWGEVAKSLTETTRTDETIKQYFSFSKDKQDEIKDVGGFVGGKLLGGTCTIKSKGKPVEHTLSEPYGWRRRGFVDHRQLVALDVDFGELDVWLDFKIYDVAGMFYTTHKHTADGPRFRIVFPLDRPVTPEEYECIARVVASWLGMDHFDDTTYQPTRLMYYPSTAKNGEFVSDINDAPVMCADDVLAELEDWRDVTKWPRSSREKEKRVSEHGTELEDPETKPGIIGAFCRAYSIEEAIAEFLNDVYIPAEDMGPDRYTYAKGSTSGGLVVYGKHAYSNHNTDPAGQRSCNAFDLVRLHKFGDLDGDKDYADPTKAPSYRAMQDFAGGIGAVKMQMIRPRPSADDYDEAEGKARRVGKLDEWVAELETDRAGVCSTIENIVKVLSNDENLAGRFGFNEFEQRETVTAAVYWDKPGTTYPRPFVDHDDAEIRLYLERVYNISGPGKIFDAITVTLRANSYHPVKQYLDACEWDGEPRLERLLIDCLGAEDTPYTKAVTRKFFTAAVARIYRPGVKFDNMLTIVGEQGIGKSTLLDKMGRQWFSDSVTSVTGKDALESLQGAWLIEMGEMTGLRKAEVDAVKHFISKRVDRYRVAYGKRVEEFARRCVFAATTNEDDFLRDATGNRRYWVINTKGGTVVLPVWDYLDEVTVAQLWGEARALYEAGEALHLDAELEADAKLIQDAHLEKDDRQGLIADYLVEELPKDWDTMAPYTRAQWIKDPVDERATKGTEQRTEVCILEIWAECLGKEPEDITRRDSFEIARAMKSMQHWRADGVKRFKFYGVQKRYVFTGVRKNKG